MLFHPFLIFFGGGQEASSSYCGVHQIIMGMFLFIIIFLKKIRLKCVSRITKVAFPSVFWQLLLPCS